MITPGELWFGRTAGTRVRLSSRRICRGGALSPPAVHGLMDVLYGPTDMSARTRSVEGDTTGGHTGPSLRDHRSAQPPPNGAGRSPPPTGAPPAVRSNGPMYLGHGFRQPNSETEFGASVIGIGPYGEKGKFPQPPGPAAHSGASTPAVARDGRGSEQGSPPKGPSTPDNPSVTAAADSSLYTREPWDGDADCHVGPAGLLAMTTVFCHSEERSDVGIRFPLVGSRDRPGSA